MGHARDWGNLFQYNDKTKRRKVGPNAPMKKLDHEQINNVRAEKKKKMGR